jgi:IPT/TIG domain
VQEEFLLFLLSGLLLSAASGHTGCAGTNTARPPEAGFASGNFRTEPKEKIESESSPSLGAIGAPMKLLSFSKSSPAFPQHVAVTGTALSILFAILITIGCGARVKGEGELKGFGFSPPSIMALTPDSVPVNSVPFTMTVNGSNFGTDAIVFWNGTPLTTTFVTANQLLASLTDTNLMFAGQIPVYVRTGGLNSNTVVFNLGQ